MRKVAFIFPGQGSQYVGMGKSLYENFAGAKEIFDSAQDILHWDIKGLCFNNKGDKINLTEYTQPAILVSSIAAWRILCEEDINADVVSGHSLGEYSALVAAGGISFAEILPVVQSRGRFMQDAVPKDEGMMAAFLGLSKESAIEVCKAASSYGTVSPANYNTHNQIVVAGLTGAVNKAMELARDRGARRVIPLNVSVPSHTLLMEISSERLSAILDKLDFSDLDIPLISNVDADMVSASSDVKDALLRQMTNPVRWDESMRTLINRGINTFVEVGPGRVLSGLQMRIAKDLDVSIDILNVEDMNSFQKTVQILKQTKGKNGNA